jgi:ABC-2 type transport system permease protein
MLWYKAWLETRTRFLISLLATTGMCGYRVFDLTRGARPGNGLDYYYFILHSGHQLLTVMWLVATTLLMMGGLLYERSAGVSAFTLGLPATRARITCIRTCMGLLEASVLIVMPWLAMFASEVVTGRPIPFAQVEFYAILLASGGAVFAGVALLVSSLVEGTYTAPMISLGIVIAFGFAPRSLGNANPLEFIGGRNFMGQGNVFDKPIPWATASVYLCVAAILIAASVKVIEKRDF